MNNASTKYLILGISLLISIPASVIAASGNSMGGQSLPDHVTSSPIAQNSHAITDNSTNIEINQSNIAQNGDNIAVNTAAIAAQKGGASVIARDGNGQLIGTVVGMGFSADSFHMLNDEGFLLPYISKATGTFVIGLHASVFYTTDDCTGQAYTPKMSNGTLFQGFSTELKLYYTPKTMAPVFDVTTGSRDSDNGCIVSDLAYAFMWPVLPNDSAITGMTNVQFTRPIQIELTK